MDQCTRQVELTGNLSQAKYWVDFGLRFE